ncbi:hypothetical protein ACOSQ4_009004 [Xanthoceras sorbifolium]
MKGLNYFNKLPEECVSAIISLTSPVDACRSSLVFSTFRSAVESDMVWERFLPSDYLDMVSRSVTTLKFSSKKELFLCLCSPLLIDGGSLSFNLEKSSGRKSYLLSARALSITWSSNPLYWCWIHMTESRFSEVAVLRTTNWLEIKGKIKTGMLSPNTKYGAYLVMKIRSGAYGLDSEEAELSVEVGDDQVWTGSAYLLCDDHHHLDKKKNVKHDLVRPSRLLIGGGDNHDHEEEEEDDQEVQQINVIREREDGWMEIELGEFFNGELLGGGDGADQEVKMSFKEVKSYHLKGGLVVEGIEVRPKH